MRATACLAGMVLVAVTGFSWSASARDEVSAGHALALLKRAARYMVTELSDEGTYVWYYSPDLKVKKGEGDAGPGVGWVQPPGTPAVGAALLRIYEATGETVWLDAARETGAALIRTQLLSGGWFYSMEMRQPGRAKWCYRADGVTPDACGKIEGNKRRNWTLLDDNTSQSALAFLMWLDAATGGGDRAAHDAVYYGLKQLSNVQYENGAWPVVIAGKRRKDDKAVPGRKASIPNEWSREWVKPEKGPYFILNDDAQSDTIHLFLRAAERYGDQQFLDAAVRAGDFLLDAQLPPPQRGWAQTYDSEMLPVWGRKFEPPSASSLETAGAIRGLLDLHALTGEMRFLRSAREAAEWLRSVRLPDGDWARFYELGTNRPLYVDEDERLTYETDNLLGHYTLKSDFNIPATLALVEGAEAQASARPLWVSAAYGKSDAELEQMVGEFLASADAEGRWIDDGWIRSGMFVDAAFAITRYLER